MVEHRPVKAIVAGSSPASGANEKSSVFRLGIFHCVLRSRTSNRRFGQPARPQELATRTGADVLCPASGAKVGNQGMMGRIVLQLIDTTHLKIESQTGACDTYPSFASAIKTYECQFLNYIAT